MSRLVLLLQLNCKYVKRTAVVNVHTIHFNSSYLIHNKTPEDGQANTMTRGSHMNV